MKAPQGLPLVSKEFQSPQLMDFELPAQSFHRRVGHLEEQHYFTLPSPSAFVPEMEQEEVLQDQPDVVVRGRACSSSATTSADVAAVAVALPATGALALPATGASSSPVALPATGASSSPVALPATGASSSPASSRTMEALESQLDDLEIRLAAATSAAVRSQSRSSPAQSSRASSLAALTLEGLTQVCSQMVVVEVVVVVVPPFFVIIILFEIVNPGPLVLLQAVLVVRAWQG